MTLLCQNGNTQINIPDIKYYFLMHWLVSALYFQAILRIVVLQKSSYSYV